MLKTHFDSHLVRMEIERVENESERAKLRYLHDRQQAYQRNLALLERNRTDGIRNISKEETQYLAQRIPKLRCAAIERLLNGSFTEAAKAARAYDERTTSIGGNANTINSVKKAANAFLTRCFPSLPFLASMVAITKDKPGLFTTPKARADVISTALYVDRWLADPRNTTNPDAFLNPKKDRKNLGAMLEIKRKISYAYAGNSFVLNGLRTWREDKHSLSLDAPFTEDIEKASYESSTKTKWHPYRFSLAEYPLVEKMSDREFIEKLKDLETQKAFVLWAYGPLERRQNERDADFAKRERARVSPRAALMNFLADAPAVQAYAKTPEAQEKAGA